MYGHTKTSKISFLKNTRTQQDDRARKIVINKTFTAFRKFEITVITVSAISWFLGDDDDDDKVDRVDKVSVRPLLQQKQSQVC